MKRCILVVFIIVFSTFYPLKCQFNCGFGALNILNELTLIEDAIFGYNYSDEPDAARLNRIETYAYGEAQSSTIVKRIERLKKDLSAIEPQKLLPPIEKTPEEIAASDPSVDYPLVDKMEEEVFKTTYKDENIYKRLDKLEENIFDETFKNAPLNDRVESLRSAILAIRNPGESSAFADEYANFIPKGGQNLNINAVEKAVLKKMYPKDSMPMRLSRLENQIFQREFASDDEQMRLERISAASIAKKTSKQYDGNRFMQYASTGMQVGMFLLMIFAMIL